MTRLPCWLWRGALGRVWLEAWGLAMLVFVLVLSVVQELPPTNVPSSFLFLTQIPVAWSALRLKPSRSARWSRVVGREALFAAGLRALVFLTAWALSSAFQAATLIRWGNTGFLSGLFIYTPSFFPYLAARLILKILAEWRKLSEKSLLWTIVNSHVAAVVSIVVLASILAWSWVQSQSFAAYYPSGLPARLVLELVRSVIPWLGVGILFLMVAVAVFFLPTLGVSYLASRRLVRRIDALVEAMAKVRRGDLSARVAPAGNDEIAQLQHDFNRMAGELQQERDKVARLLKNQRELSAVVSHELRTPISVMRAHVEKDLFKTPDALPAGYRHNLETLHHETLKLQDLVEDLFTLSQLDQRRLSLACSQVDVSEVIERVASSLKGLAWENKRVDLSAQVRPGLPPVWADARRLEQVLSNLVQNAIRHNVPGGVILLQAEPAGEGVQINVIDSGEGIPPEHLPHVWERYYRGAGGTGIGLSLVKELVESMGGSVGVQSRPGEGSRFWVHLLTRDPFSA